MRTQYVLLLAIALSFGWPAAAQMATVEDYLKRLSSIDPKEASEADCAAQGAQANNLNAADLFYASAVCHAVKKEIEGNFLLSAGQVRGSADMATMAPASKADLEAAAALYGFIYFHAGGPGNIEVLRSPQSRDRFFQLFDSWAPTSNADYSPGWKVGQRPDDAEYQKALAEIKAGRRLQLSEMSRLYSDNEYYALQRQFDELQKRTSGRYVAGTSDSKLASDLQQRMDQRARALGIRHETPNWDSIKERKTPPSAPGKDETVVSASADPAVKQCSDWAERLARMSLSKIVRIVMTTGSEWGLVWRADIASSDDPPEMSRFICSKYGTMYQSGNALERPPLP
jgi:hypothetical protein